MGLFDIFKKKETKSAPEFEVIFSPLNGELVPLAEVNDPVFSSGALGKGVGIKPADGKVVAPVTGTVVSAFPTGHAFGIVTPAGAEVLVHIGINTVDLKGEGFTMQLSEGQQVQAGEAIGEFDIATIQEHGLEPTTMVIITNSDNYLTIDVEDTATVSHKDALLKLHKSN